MTLHLASALDSGRTDFRVRGGETWTAVRINANHALLIWEPEYGPAPVPDLEHLEPRPLSAELLETCPGSYMVEKAGLKVEVRAEGGHLTLELRGKSERLIHTGMKRFRARNGFVIFQAEGARAESLLFIPDSGDARRAKRVP